jgi:hypothetical protein
MYMKPQKSPYSMKLLVKLALYCIATCTCQFLTNAGFGQIPGGHFEQHIQPPVIAGQQIGGENCRLYTTT